MVGVAGTALGGIIASLVILWVQDRRDEHVRPGREVAVARAVERDAVLRSLTASTIEIEHSVGHLRLGHEGYREAIEEHALAMRKKSREHHDLVGAEVGRAVTNYTDQLLTELPSLGPSGEPSEALERRTIYLTGGDPRAIAYSFPRRRRPRRSAYLSAFLVFAEHRTRRTVS